VGFSHLVWFVQCNWRWLCTYQRWHEIFCIIWRCRSVTLSRIVIFFQFPIVSEMVLTVRGSVNQTCCWSRLWKRVKYIKLEIKLQLVCSVIQWCRSSLVVLRSNTCHLIFFSISCKQRCAAWIKWRSINLNALDNNDLNYFALLWRNGTTFPVRKHRAWKEWK